MGNVSGRQTNDTLTGTSQPDSIIGFGGNDVISGGAAADSLWGAAGNDSLRGGDGDDVLYGDSELPQTWGWQVYNRNFSSADGQANTIENGTLAGSGLSSNFDVGAHALAARNATGDPNDFGVIYTSSFTATVSGSYRFTLSSDDGSRLILRDASGTALAWSNQTTGQAGLRYLNNDFHQSLASRGANVTLDAGQTYQIEVRYWENEGSNLLSGTVQAPGGAVQGLATAPQIGIGAYAGNDSLYGEGGDDTLYGEGGNDLLDGGSGNDLLFGGDGADALYGGTGADTLYGGAGHDTIFGGTDADPDLIFGDAGDDVITTGHGSLLVADTVFGGAGNDTVYGGSGIDLLYGDAGNDSISGLAGNDTIYGGSGDDLLSGDDGDDLLFGGPGDDSLYGGDGNDTLVGGAGADLLYGAAGMDYADYSESDAGVHVDLTTNIGLGGHAQGDSLQGIDGLIGSEFDDTLIGFDGQSNDPLIGYTNVFYGGNGNDLLDGRGGDDRLFGGDGNDTLVGGSGDDYLDGGAGSDRFVIADGWGHDTVIGGETLDDLDRIDASTVTADLAVSFSGPEAGSLTGTGGSIGFSEIEALTLGSGNDSVNIEAGMGPINLDGGAGTDRLTISGQALERDDVTLDDSASGQFWPQGGGGPIAFGPGEPRLLSTVLAQHAAGQIVVTGGSLSGTVGDITFQNFEHIAFDIVCFLRGTRIATDRGEVDVQRLAPGDRIWTLDHGYQPLRWIGSARRPALGRLAPVRIPAGRLGNRRDLLVSPQHRLLLRGWQAGLMFGEPEVLAPAIALTSGAGIRQVCGGTAEYWHLLFDRHEIVLAEGAPAESFHPGAAALRALDAPARAEILHLFPELAAVSSTCRPPARPVLRSYEGRLLAAVLWPQAIVEPASPLLAV